MASLLNEEIMKTNLDIPEGEIKIEGKANPVYADAINVHNKKKKEREKVLKDKKDELKKPFLGTKGNTTTMPKTKDMKKLKLSEDLFKNEAAVMDRKSWELKDKRNNKDTWSDIYNELVGIKGIEAPHRRLKTNDRYKASWGDNPEESDAIRVGASRDGGIVVKADEMPALDFAKEVAETYGVEWRVKEHTSRYADAKYELFIYPDRPVVNETLDTAKAFGRKAKSKDLKESANGEIYSKVVKYFEYGAPGETVDTVCDIVDRAVSNIEDGYDFDEAVFDALDNGLIYHKDNWAIKHYYEDSELLDGTYEALYNDVYSIVSDLVEDDDVDEGLTSAQRHNRKMDRIFQDKKDRDSRMSKFLKDNSDITDDELKKVQDDDKVGLELKNRGLHDRYWNEVEGKNESLKKRSRRGRK